MDQLTLNLSSPLSRSSDPATSRDSAIKAQAFKARDISRIWAALRDYGPMNKNAIAKVTGIDAVAICRRFAEMERKGLIGYTGDVIEGCRVARALA